MRSKERNRKKIYCFGVLLNRKKANSKAFLIALNLLLDMFIRAITVRFPFMSLFNRIEIDKCI